MTAPARRERPLRRKDAARSTSAAGERGETVRLGGLDRHIGFRLRLAQDASFRTFARHTGEHDLKPGHFAAITVIGANPGISLGALGRAIARDKSTITPLVKSLLRSGFVERNRSTRDGRSSRLHLTASGEAMREKLARAARDHDRKLDAIVDARKQEFLQLLRRIAETLA